VAKDCLPIRWILGDLRTSLLSGAPYNSVDVLVALDEFEGRFRLAHPGWEIADREDGRP
jgi:hypothetical protein